MNNETAGFSLPGPGPQYVFMNGRAHHYMRIATSTSQNCGISYFIFDEIASLAGSADAQNVDPLILFHICKGLKDENPYCANHRFLGVEARTRAEGITLIPRMVDQVQHFDICLVVNYSVSLPYLLLIHSYMGVYRRPMGQLLVSGNRSSCSC